MLNTSLVLQLLQFSFFWGTDFPEEFYVKRLITVAQNGQHLAISYIEGLSSQVSIYDFTTNSILKVDDGRILAIMPSLIPYKDGFVILNSIPIANSKYYYVDRQGKWVWTRQLTSVPGWEAGGLLRTATHGAQGDALFTTHHEDFVVFHLFDIDKNLITKIGQIPRGTNKLYYSGVLRDNFVYTICRTNGEIISYQVDDWKKKVLQKARDSKKDIILGFPHIVGNKITMNYCDRIKETDQINSLNILPGNLLQFNPLLLVGQYQNKKLFYDINSGEFSLKD